ncbi:MAG: hypothetical protein AB1813_17510 [Verrucomicrobiota bacterium]|jgi:hypothetical protein
MAERADARRRWFGLFFLLLAGGMLIWGQTVLKSVLQGWVFIIYWLICFGFTALAMGVALLDFWIVRRQARRQQKDLLRDTLLKSPSDRESESDESK